MGIEYIEGWPVRDERTPRLIQASEQFLAAAAAQETRDREHRCADGRPWDDSGLLDPLLVCMIKLELGEASVMGGISPERNGRANAEKCAAIASGAVPIGLPFEVRA